MSALNFGSQKTPAQLHQEYLDKKAFCRIDKRFGVIGNLAAWLDEQDWKDANSRLAKNPQKQRILQKKTAGRRTRQRGAVTRSNAASGDGNSDEPEPEPERHAKNFTLYDQAALAELIGISKKTLQNLFSRTPDLLPPAIKIPGGRGPRWTAKSVEKWLDQQPVYVATTIPIVADAQKRKVGRPRIVAAQQSAGGAA